MLRSGQIYQKCTILDDLRAITQEETKKTRQITSFFFYILSPNCLWYSFLYLKIVKIHFHGVPFMVYSGLQNTWIWEVKAVRSEFCSIWFRKHIRESKKLGFIFSIDLRTKCFWFHGFLQITNVFRKPSNPSCQKKFIFLKESISPKKKTTLY